MTRKGRIRKWLRKARLSLFNVSIEVKYITENKKK